MHTNEYTQRRCMLKTKENIFMPHTYTHTHTSESSLQAIENILACTAWVWAYILWNINTSECVSLLTYALLAVDATMWQVDMINTLYILSYALNLFLWNTYRICMCINFVYLLCVLTTICYVLCVWRTFVYVCLCVCVYAEWRLLVSEGCVEHKELTEFNLPVFQNIDGIYILHKLIELILREFFWTASHIMDDTNVPSHSKDQNISGQLNRCVSTVYCVLNFTKSFNSIFLFICVDQQRKKHQAKTQKIIGNGKRHRLRQWI